MTDNKRTVEMRPGLLASLITGAVTIASLVGFSAGVGSWGGEVRQILVEHERRLTAQDDRDERQDDHMVAIDREAAETRTVLATIRAQVGYLVRQAQADEPLHYGNR